MVNVENEEDLIDGPVESNIQLFHDLVDFRK